MTLLLQPPQSREQSFLGAPELVASIMHWTATQRELSECVFKKKKTFCRQTMQWKMHFGGRKKKKKCCPTE